MLCDGRCPAHRERGNRFFIFFRNTEIDNDASSFCCYGRHGHSNGIANMPLDPRRVAGGTLWARAESVTHDAKRIYGAALPRTWVRGTVIGCSSELKNAQAKRATSYVRASFMVGNTLYEKQLPLAVTEAVLRMCCRPQLFSCS
jgi:hypothetical protein